MMDHDDGGTMFHYLSGLYTVCGLYVWPVWLICLYVATSGNKIQRNQEHDDGLTMINPFSYERTSLCPRNEEIQRPCFYRVIKNRSPTNDHKCKSLVCLRLDGFTTSATKSVFFKQGMKAPRGGGWHVSFQE